MKKFLAVLSLSTLLALPVWADDAVAPAVDKTAPVASSSADETAPAVAPAEGAAPVKKMKTGKAAKSGVDEAGIKKAFEAVSAAWAAGDATAVVKNFTPDVSIINPIGAEGWGREEAEKVVANDLQMFKGTTQTFSDFKFTRIMDTVVLVDCTGTITGGTDAGEKKMHVYSLVVNRGHGWQARSVRPYAFMPAPGSAPAASAPAAVPAVAPAGASVPPAADVAMPKMDTKGK